MSDYRVEVHGSVGGNLVVGDHNLIVNAAVGSSVSVVQEALRPKPVRRTDIRVLPRRGPQVIGRSGELGAVMAAVVEGTTIQVYGQPGMGKSALLRQVAFDVADEADGVVFLSATGRSHIDIPQEIFEACYETSGYRPSPTELRRLMAGVRAAVVADDLVCSPDDLNGVLDAAPDAAFVFAAAERELYGSGRVIELHGLIESDAVALVTRELGRDLSAAEVDAVRAEWRAEAGSPMRLLRAAAMLGQPAPDRPAPADGEPTVGDETALVASLPAAERDVYRLLSYIAPAIATVPVIAALVATDHVDHVATATERLVRAGLADRVGTDSFRIADDLVVPVVDRQYRRDVVALVESVRAWLTRPGATPSDTSDHGELIVALIEAAAAAGHGDVGTRLARTAAPPAALSLRWGVWRDVLTSGQAAAKACDDREAYAYFTHERGIRLLCLGQAAAAAAVLTTAIGLWQALGLHASASVASAAAQAATGAATAAGASGQAAAGGHAVAAAHVGHLGTPPPPAPASPPPAAPPPPSAPMPPSTPPPPLPRPATGGTSRPSRAVGRASVRSGSGFPTALVVTIAAVVVLLGVAALLVVPHLRSDSSAVRPAPPIASPLSTPTGPTPSLPPPIAFSDNSARGSDPARVLDGDDTTFWSSTPLRRPETDDSWIGLDMGGLGVWTGLSVTPREPSLGFPSGFRIETSLDGVTWRTVQGPAYEQFQAAEPVPLVFTFGQPVEARYIRLFATLLTRAAVPASVEVNAPYVLQIAEMKALN